MIELPTLYSHQEDLRDRTRSALAKHGRVILTAAPGMGKTRTAKWILGAAANRPAKENQSGKSLFTVHRRGLVQNATDSFHESPRLPHGVIMSGVQSKMNHRVQVASIDTLLSWFVEDGYSSNITFDLIAWDEAHSHHPKFSRFLKYHDERRKELGLHPAFVIGLTATPQAKGLADVYREIVLGPSTQWLIENGFLSPFRYFRATTGKMDLLKKSSTGDFTKDSEAAAMDGLAGDLVRDWKKFAEGRPTVGFFPRRTHAQEAVDELKKAGLRVAYVDGETSDESRKRIFWELNEHRIDYVCNVQVIERGTDIPRIGCVQLCVAIGSLVRYLQMIGRGSRIHPAKKDCLVLDHGGNVLRHGFFEDEQQWTLDNTTKDPGEQGARPTIECPKCSAIYRGGKCSRCGYEPTPKERKSQGLEFDGSELKEVKPSEKKKKSVKTAHDLMVSCLYRAGGSGRTWKQAVGMFYGECKKEGVSYRVPKSVTIAGQEYQMLRYGSLDAGRRVEDLFPFTSNNSKGKY